MTGSYNNIRTIYVLRKIYYISRKTLDSVVATNLLRIFIAKHNRNRNLYNKFREKIESACAMLLCTFAQADFAMDIL